MTASKKPTPFGTRWHADAEWEIPRALKRYAIVRADGVALKWAMYRSELVGSCLLEGNGVRILPARNLKEGKQDG